MESKILLSVDMDEWYQCRWATGSEYALWPDIQMFFREYYQSDGPIGEIIPLTDRILELFSCYDIHATFFITGEMANYYPELVRGITDLGHEIASHNYAHKDYDDSNRDEFYDNLKKSKELLEEISGQTVLGYRAPNSTISNYMIEALLDLGFKYDSSVTSTRPFMGKFGHFTNAPINPYELSETDFATPGKSGLWEFPWPVFPILRLPSGSGIVSRIAGYWYTIASIEHALKTGDTVYYFHPYEIGPYPDIQGLNLRTRIFLRNLGDNYFGMLHMLIKRYQGRFTSGRELLKKHTAKGHVVHVS